MNLQSYIERYSAADLARALEVTPSFVTQMAAGGAKGRPVPIPRCVQIERATRGKVTRQELRADWREIWPELEAIERAARAIRAARRLSRRNGAAAYPWPTSRRDKPLSIDDLLKLSVTNRLGLVNPLLREIRRHQSAAISSATGAAASSTVES